MNRREFLKTTGTTSLLASLPVLTPAIPPLPARLIPEDKGITPEMLAALRQRGTRRVYRGPQRFAIGMPCAGIAAGQLYVLGDGTLGGWHVDGRLNSTGWGADNYKVRAQPRELDQGFDLTIVPDGGKALTLTLADATSGGSFDAIEFIGEYPVAEVRYRKTGEPLPVEVTLHAGAPFIPLNAKDSALPCTVLRWTIKNTSSSRLRVQLRGWLQNGVELKPAEEPQPTRTNRVVRDKGLTAVLMEASARRDQNGGGEDRVLFDFEGADFAGWQVEGTAFAEGPARGARAHQSPVAGFQGTGFVDSFTTAENVTAGDAPMGTLTSPEFTIDRRYMTLLVGGGSHATNTCVNLLVEGKRVRSAAGKNAEKLEPRAWDVREFAGRKARLEIVDKASGPWGHVNADQVVLTDTMPTLLAGTGADSPGFGTVVLAFLGEGEGAANHSGPAAVGGLGPETSTSEGPIKDAPVGIIRAAIDLSPGEAREAVFVVTWNFPNLHTSQGQMYANWFADAIDVAKYVRDNLGRLARETELFRKTWYDDTTLPWWLALRLFMPTANLATGTAQWWKNGRFWGWEGVGCCHGTCTHVWNYSHAEARLFPETARSTRVMQDLDSGFEEATGRVAFRGEVSRGFEYAGDGQSGTVLKCYREHLCSPDTSFLKANWERIKKVLDYQVARDAMVRGGDPGEPDGIIEVTQHNTYDINFEGPNTFVGSLYLASLLAGARMAEIAGDAPAAERYRAIAARGRAFTERNLFKDGYFIQQIPEDASQQWQYGRGCLSDQLFGQNWARCLDLGTVYEEEMVRSALNAVFRFNWSPVVGQYNAKFPPERWFAEGKEGGLFVCTWPKGGRSSEPVRYRDEVWTGCEYQAAGGMAWEGMLDEALVIVKAIDERYDGTTHNPWNEIECGDHYARAMASYGVFQAICGFAYDGPAGTLGLAPRLSPENFAVFFSGAEGWGLATQVREGRKQTNRFEVRWGTVRLTTVALEVPLDSNVKAGVAVAGRPLRATVDQRRTSVRVRLSEPLVLKAGETLEITASS